MIRVVCDANHRVEADTPADTLLTKVRYKSFHDPVRSQAGLGQLKPSSGNIHSIDRDI